MNESPTLRRTLTLPILVFYGVGTIMGAGIYALVGKVAGMSGMFTPVAFFTSAVLAGLTGYSYAVLSSKYPLSSGEAVYLQKAFKIKALSLLVGLAVALSGIVSSAAISNGFVGYFQVFVDMPGWLINTAVIVSMGLLAIWGIKQSAIAATVVTIIEVLGLIIVIWVTKDNFLTIPDRLPEMIPPMEFASWQAIFAGAFLAFYAFIGFEDLVNVAEEVKNPEKTLPRALGISIVTVTILYVLLGVVGILTLPPAELAASDAPLALLYEKSTGSFPYFITIIGLLAVLNGLLVQIIMASRILYGLSSAGWLPAILKSVNPKTRTPIFSTVLITLIILTLAIAFPIVRLAQATSAIIMVVFALVNASAFWVQWRDDRRRNLLSYRLFLPIIGVVATVGLIVLQLYSIL